MTTTLQGLLETAVAGGDGILAQAPESVRLMTTDHLTREQRDASTLFLEGAGWRHAFAGS
jgi:hypothetical protein